MSIRDLYGKTVEAELPDGTVVTFARMGVSRWAKLAKQIRDERVAAELKAIGATKDPIMQQTLRLRAQAFEPSYYDLIDSAQTPEAICRLLPFAAIEGGTAKELADELVDLLTPGQVQQVMGEITHAPVGARLGGDLAEGQRPNPTPAESSPPATGSDAQSSGSESPSTSTGETSDGGSSSTTDATSTP